MTESMTDQVRGLAEMDLADIQPVSVFPDEDRPGAWPRS